MSFELEYKQKLTTAEEAVKVVKSGDWVDYTWCMTHPVALDKALAARKDELTDVKVRGGVTMWMPEIAKADDAGEHFTWHSWHCSGVDRKVIKKGMGYFGPIRYSELPNYYRDNVEDIDVVMFSVPPMDRFGNFNFSLSPSHTDAILSRAKHVIVEVNEELSDSPENLNSDPYGSWIIKVEQISETEELMDAAAYEAFCAEEG